MNVFDKFNKTDYDKTVVLKNHDRFYTFEEVKHLVYAQMIEFNKEKSANLMLTSFDNFNFIINFLAAVFSGKEILLIDDKHRLAEIYFEFFEPEEFDETGPNNILFKKINPKETFVTFLTSGTVSEPKQIRKSLYNLIKEAEDVYKEFPNLFNENMIFTTTTKLSHLFGLTFQFMVPFVNGFIIDCGQISGPNQIDTENAVFISPPSFLERLERNNAKVPVEPKLIFSAGDKLKDETFKYLEKKSKVVEIYGSTETGTIAYRRSTRTPEFRPFSNVEVDTDKENNIIVKSEYFYEELMKLDDKIEMKDKKHFILKDRNDRLMKIHERRISSLKLEELINSHSLVECSYCFKTNEKVGTAVVLNEDGKNYFIAKGKVNLVKVIKSYLSNYMEVVPQKWRFIFEIPKLETGKVNKPILRKIFEANLSIPFITDVKVEGDIAEMDLMFPRNSNFFRGHFEGHPVVPSVVQLTNVHWFIGYLFRIACPTHELRRLKFTKPIKPDQLVKLKIKNTPYSIDFAYYDDDNIYSSGIFIKEGVDTSGILHS